MAAAEGSNVGSVSYELAPAESDGSIFGTPEALDPQAPFRASQAPPLLTTDGIGQSMDDLYKTFETENRGTVLTNSDQQGVSNFAYPSDLLQQKMAADEMPSLAVTYANAGSVAPGKKGGLMSGRTNTVIAGNTRKPPEDVGNPRVGVKTLGVIPDGESPAESEEALRKQIIESIRTEPTTRLDQSVAIPELYQQVNPVAKLGFPIMQTRPQFQEDFVRGRLSLPKQLTIDPSAAITAETDAYSHVASLDNLRAVYTQEYNGDVPVAPSGIASANGKESLLPPFDSSFYPDTRNPTAPNSSVPDIGPEALAPLMYGGKVEPLPDSFGKGAAPGAEPADWPLSGNGYRVDGVRGSMPRDFATVDTISS